MEVTVGLMEDCISSDNVASGWLSIVKGRVCE